MKFKVGDRVVCFEQVFDDLSNLNEWSGIIGEVRGEEVVKINCKDGINWVDYVDNLILEDVFFSPLYQALK